MSEYIGPTSKKRIYIAHCRKTSNHADSLAIGVMLWLTESDGRVRKMRSLFCGTLTTLG